MFFVPQNVIIVKDSTKTLFLSNFPTDTTEVEIADLLGGFFNAVLEINISREKGSGRGKGYGYATVEGLKNPNAFSRLNGIRFKDRSLRVRIES